MEHDGKDVGRAGQVSLLTPKISVVMSVYNDAGELSATIDSVLAQSEVDFELVIVDDGSSDETPVILARYARDHPRVRIIGQENQGLTRALIRGCAAARGDYIARQDSGDLSAATRLERQRAVLDANRDVSFVSSWTAYVGPGMEPLYVQKGRAIAIEPVVLPRDPATGGLADGPTHHGSVTFRRDAYLRAGGYREAFYYGQDWDLWFRLSELGKFQTIGEVLYVARITPDGISGSAKSLQESFGRLALEAFRMRQRGEDDGPVLARAAELGHAARQRRGRPGRGTGLYFIGECLRRNRDERARHYFRLAIDDEPWNLKVWLRLGQLLLAKASRRPS